mmetsp:Transcript_145033/g.404003  ORF Transcript_145033/g.404003 Transcript_145033/m.404003 type:complete len:93 (+) Transcript_145033:531-809(+)
MHDTAHFESCGIPSVAVLSSEFKAQAAYQARMLGLDELRAEFVAHPISDASAEDMERKAVGALAGVLRALCSTEASDLQKVEELLPPTTCDS